MKEEFAPFVSGKEVEGRKRDVPVDRILQSVRGHVKNTRTKNGLPPSAEAAVKHMLWLCIGTEAFDELGPERAHAVRVMKRWKRIYGSQR